MFKAISIPVLISLAVGIILGVIMVSFMDPHAAQKKVNREYQVSVKQCKQKIKWQIPETAEQHEKMNRCLFLAARKYHEDEKNATDFVL